MRKTHTLGQITLAVLTLAAAGAAQATNGYFSHGYGIKAKGMGGASVAMAQDAFAGANNPAAAAFAGNRYDVGVDLFMPDRSMSRVAPGFGGLLEVDVKSNQTAFLVPEFGYNVALSNQLGLGLTVYGNGGMNTNYPGGQTTCPDPADPQNNPPFPGMNPLCGVGKLGVNLMQLIIAPTMAWKMNEQHSVGISPLFVYQAFKAYGLEGFLGMSSDPTALTGVGSDSSTGFGFKLGYFGKLNDSVTLGASYSPKVNMSKFKKYAGLFAEQGDFDIPANLTLGMALKATPNVTVALDFQRINYGDVKSIANPMTNPPPLGADNGPGFGWRDINVWKLGVQWQVDEKLTLRAGYNKGQNPIVPRDITFNILAPGVVTDHLTLGATLQMDKMSELSFSYAHARQKSVSGVSMFDFASMGGPGNGTIRETIGMNQNSFGIQYSRKF